MKNKDLLLQASSLLSNPAKGLSASVDIAIDNLIIEINKKTRGGKRPNSGRKTKYVSREVKLSKEHNEALKVKFGRSFNQVFREWVSTLINC